jgi:hypothetical protein
MPDARASMRGFALNWRLAVNGIQKASSSARESELVDMADLGEKAANDKKN